jgi:hypothetical protein
VRASRPIEGRTFVVDFHDLAASLGYLRRGALTFLDWRRPSRLARGFLLLPAPLFCQDWVVYCKPPFGGPEHVLHYVRTVVWQGSAGDRRPYADQAPQCLSSSCRWLASYQ